MNIHSQTKALCTHCLQVHTSFRDTDLGYSGYNCCFCCMHCNVYLVFSLTSVCAHIDLCPLYVCSPDSEPPLSGQAEHFLDLGAISLLRAELGLSSPDLFSMTVTDYDIKASVRKSHLSFPSLAFSCLFGFLIADKFSD